MLEENTASDNLIPLKEEDERLVSNDQSFLQKMQSRAKWEYIMEDGKKKGVMIAFPYGSHASESYVLLGWSLCGDGDEFDRTVYQNCSENVKVSKGYGVALAYNRAIAWAEKEFRGVSVNRIANQVPSPIAEILSDFYADMCRYYKDHMPLHWPVLILHTKRFDNYRKKQDAILAEEVSNGETSE